MSERVQELEGQLSFALKAMEAAQAALELNQAISANRIRDLEAALREAQESAFLPTELDARIDALLGDKP